MSALMEDPSTDLAQLEQASDVAADQGRVVSLGDPLPVSDPSTLDSTIPDHQCNLSEVRDAVVSRQALGGALSQGGAAAEDVVVVDVLDEDIVLYTRSAQ